MSMLIHGIIGEFHLVKQNRLLHPLDTRRRRIRMNIKAAYGVRLRFSCHIPLGVIVFVAIVVGRYHVHEQNVFGLRLQARYVNLKRGEHAATTLGYDHLGADLGKLIPQRLRLEFNVYVGVRGLHGGLIIVHWILLAPVRVNTSVIIEIIGNGHLDKAICELCGAVLTFDFNFRRATAATCAVIRISDRLSAYWVFDLGRGLVHES